MIHYVVANNPDDRILNQIANLLTNGGVVSFPTDTNWVLAASPFSRKGVDSLYKIKAINRKKHLSLLCNNISQASKYAIISNNTFRLIKRKIPGPFTFIFNPRKDIPRTIKDYRKDGEIGIRIPDSILTQRLIDAFEGPIITTSISPEMLELPTNDDGEEEIFSYQIEDYFQHQVNCIIDPCQENPLLPSSIVDFSNDDVPVIIREGAGNISDFQ